MKNRWLDVFAGSVSEEALGRHVLAEGNFLWHVFSYGLVPCLSGDAARQALDKLPAGTAYLFYEGLWQDLPCVQPVELPLAPDFFAGRHDVYLVDQDFTWTYVYTHEETCGPYFCQAAKNG
ncbi:DUF4275 family protein [Dysosmobacter sp.]